MRLSYAVTWQADGLTHSGRLELQPDALAFEGSDRAGSAVERVRYEDLTGVRVARSHEDRLAGRQTLVVERRTGPAIRIGGVVHPGIVPELAERLPALISGAAT